MDSLAMAAGSAGVIELNGKTLTANRLTGGDMGKYRAFVRKKLSDIKSPFELIREDLKHLPKREKAQVLKMAYENRVAHTSLTSPQAQEIMESEESTAYLLWLSIRPNHPDLSYEQTLEMVNAADLKAVQTILNIINGVEDDDKKKDVIERNGNG